MAVTRNMNPKKCPMPSQEPDVRNKNFDEVALGYTYDMAVNEAKRCLNCPTKPCRSACPVQIDIPAFIERVANEDMEGAYRVLTASSALPAVCGRVCPQENQCEGKCVRGIKGESVAIGRLERFVADWHREHVADHPQAPAPNGHKVAIIGAGLPRFMGIPGESLKGVYSANEYLTRINLMKAYRADSKTPIRHSGKVAVVGGGNVAMDAARSAKRLGAKEVYIVYRRGMEELPARREEVEHAEEEGIIFKTLTNPVEVLGNENGEVCGMRCVEMELGEPDASGRRRPIVKEGSEFVLDVDTMIMSIGTSPNPLIRHTTPGLETNRHGCIVTNGEDGLTSREGVYAGGDAVTGAATVILAMGAGKHAAKAIDEYIMEMANVGGAQAKPQTAAASKETVEAEAVRR